MAELNRPAARAAGATVVTPHTSEIIVVAQQAAKLGVVIDIAATIASGISPAALKARLFNEISGCPLAPEPQGRLQ